MPGNQADSWANYFLELTTPIDDSTFDDEYNRHIRVMYLLQALTAQGDTRDPVTLNDIIKYVKTLKSGKSPDIYSLI